ncbi:tetratricopeptide repeat protein, partial [Acinetobacter baumannii]
MHNIALTLQYMGQYTDALDAYKQVKEIAINVLGEEHPYFLKTLRCTI